MLLEKNYHTHTVRCGHANGSEEEMVKAAIACGIKVLGMSDHIPVLEDDQPRKMRMPLNQMEPYIKEVNRLKEKYKNEIQIYLGFEAEYIETQIPLYKKLLDTKEIDYLILGQHCYEQFSFDHMSGRVSSPQEINRYVQTCIQGLETGLYKYLAHPDLFMMNYPQWDEGCEKAAYDLAKASLRLDIPLEYNAEGLRPGIIKGRYLDGDRFRYPHRKFWEIVAKVGCKVIIGADAHNPEDLGDEAVALCIHNVKELGLNWQQNIDFHSTIR